MTTTHAPEPLATYRLSAVLRMALAGAAGPLPHIAAETMVNLALVRETAGLMVTAEWAARTYLAVLNTLERQNALPTAPRRQRS